MYQERDKGSGQRHREETAGSGNEDSEPGSGQRGDTCSQHVEAVEQVEAVHEDDAGGHDERHTDPTGYVDRLGDGDESSHSELCGEAR